MEVDLVWNSKWNFVTGLYFFQRYLPFIDTTWLILYCQSDSLSIVLSSSFCRSIGGKFDDDCVSEFKLYQWRFVELTFPSIFIGMHRKDTYFTPSNDACWNCCIRG